MIQNGAKTSLSPAQSRRCAAQLEGSFLFHGFSQEEIAALLGMQGVFMQKFAAGEPLLGAAEGANEPMLGILLRGAAVVEKRGSEEEGLLRIGELAPGELFGMASLFLAEAQPHPTRVLALRECAALMIPEHVFADMLAGSFPLAMNYIRHLTGRIHFLNRRIDGLIQPTVAGRVLLYITQNAKHGKLKHSLTQLAQALSISRATLYRALEVLEEQCVIRREGRQITLLTEHNHKED